MRKKFVWLFVLTIPAIFLFSCTLLVDFSQKPQETCGNGMLDPGEDCDGDKFNSIDLSCPSQESPVCMGCHWVCPEDFCGNGTVETWENPGCEGFEDEPVECPGGVSASCDALCRNFCPEVSCGNNVLDAGEDCDFVNGEAQYNNNVDCSPGFQLECNNDCRTQCISTCGDGILATPAEQCDFADHTQILCRNSGFWGGLFECTEECTLNDDNCTSALLLGADLGAKAADIAVDRDGNIYVFATVKGDFLGTTDNSVTDKTDMVLVKWNREGNRLWVKRFSQFKGDDTAVALVVDNNVSPLVVYGVGTVTGRGDISGDFSKNIYVFKIDSNGNIIDSVFLTSSNTGGNADDEATGIRLGSGGAVYVTGRMKGNVGSQENAGGFDGYIAKLNGANLSGGIPWQALVGSDADDTIVDCAEDAAAVLRVLYQYSNTVQMLALNTADGQPTENPQYQPTILPISLENVSDVTAISMDIHPDDRNVYVAVNYQTNDGEPETRIVKVGLNTVFDSPAILPQRESRRVRFWNDAVYVLGVTGNSVNGNSPIGYQVFLSKLQPDNLMEIAVIPFDAAGDDEATGIAFDGDVAACMCGKSRAAFSIFSQKTDTNEAKNGDNIAAWCIVPDFQQ